MDSYTSTNTDQAEPAEVVDSFFAAIEAGRIEDVIALLDPQVSWEVPGDPSAVPWVGHRVGPEAVRDFYTCLLEETEREAFSFGPVLTENELVLVPGNFAYRFPRTCGYYSGEFVIAFTVREGRILRYQMHEDSFGLGVAYEGRGH
ncbi:nuclear transport factor 2 family protein [Rhodococcus sp. NPDC058521]|uniref:nuclear transport factor 2 family protein n=1 Tax=Rhodococcus sp. NPDC058521 TaxID=3346536 RepID=UPI003660DC73